MADKPSHSDVTYYDQLGVPRNAPVEDIRRAYKSLVRILHPDHQTDPELKEAAEAQLRRLNRMHSVLCDPAQRTAYDQFLLDEVAPPILVEEDDDPKLRLRKLALRGALIGAVLIMLTFIFWLGAQSSPGEQSAAVRARNQAPGSLDAESLRTQLAQTLKERDQAVAALVQLRSQLGSRTPTRMEPPSSVPTPPQNRPAVPVLTELPTSAAGLPPIQTGIPSSQLPQTPAMTGPAGSQLHKLSGFWAYVRPKDGQKNEDRSLYLPEFIEISIKDEGGLLKGRYRARYKVADRPISPDVNFEFSGKELNGMCNCFWTGIAGARGPIHLQLTGDNSLTFEWSATVTGTQQGLAAGKAVLIRRPE